MPSTLAYVQESPGVGRLMPVGERDLPIGDALVQVEWSSLNYKDALALAGRPGIVRCYPMVPGIDLAGTVLEPGESDLEFGDRVVVTGWGLGEARWGGYSWLARVPSEWLLPIPSVFSTRQAAALGTAGLTAMLAVLALAGSGVYPDGLPVAVSGASGGVGSLSVALLGAAGYPVVASTGKTKAHGMLADLGAKVVSREELLVSAQQELGKARWAGAVDTVGGATLGSLVRNVREGGCVAATGMAGGTRFETSVFPFILRGVKLAGIQSVTVPQDVREDAWRRLGEALRGEVLDGLTRDVGLEDLEEEAARMLAGGGFGRTVVRVG